MEVYLRVALTQGWSLRLDSKREKLRGRESRDEIAYLYFSVWGQKSFLSRGRVSHDHIAQWSFSKFCGGGFPHSLALYVSPALESMWEFTASAWLMSWSSSTDSLLKTMSIEEKQVGLIGLFPLHLVPCVWIFCRF